MNNIMPSHARALVHNLLLALLTTMTVVGCFGSSPNAATDELAKAVAAFDSQEYEQAIEHYNAAIELDSCCAEAYAGRGVARMRLGNHTQAIDDQTAAIQLDPELAEAFAFRGTSYAALEDYDKAFADFAKTRELDAQQQKRQ